MILNLRLMGESKKVHNSSIPSIRFTDSLIGNLGAPFYEEDPDPVEHRGPANLEPLAEDMEMQVQPRVTPALGRNED